MTIPLRYTPSEWYWAVAGSTTQVFSSAAAAYVATNDPTYAAWLAAGGTPTKILIEADLWDVLALQYPAGLPSATTAAQNAGKDVEWQSLPLGAKKLLFNHENRIRVLEGKAPLTLLQFIIAYRLISSPS